MQRRCQRRRGRLGENWGWYDPLRPDATHAPAVALAERYIDSHVARTVTLRSRSCSRSSASPATATTSIRSRRSPCAIATTPRSSGSSMRPRRPTPWPGPTSGRTQETRGRCQRSACSGSLEIRSPATSPRAARLVQHLQHGHVHARYRQAVLGADERAGSRVQRRSVAISAAPRPPSLTFDPPLVILGPWSGEAASRPEAASACVSPPGPQ